MGVMRKLLNGIFKIYKHKDDSRELKH